MSDVVIASSESDARAAEAVERHHAEMRGTLARYTENLVDAVSKGDLEASGKAQQRLVTWCEEELLPHALAEEEMLYPAARRTDGGRLLVEGMLAEHELIAALVRQLAGAEAATDFVRVAASGTALRAVFESHLAKENDLLLPLLLQAPGVSVGAMLEGMHELIGGPSEAGDTEGCGSGHGCTCGEAEPAGHPELDARTIPHAIRHATILGALETVRSGNGLVLVAPHDPLPLLGQVEDRWPGRFAVDYLERGPAAWRLSFVRRGA